MFAPLRPNFTSGLKVPRICAALAGLWLLLGGPAALAQDAGDRPARTSEAIYALENATWSELATGLSLLQASTALGTRLTVLKIKPDNYRFAIEQGAAADGERADDILERSEARIVVNGGFFSINKDGRLSPVGMLVDNGVAVSSPWLITGGFVGINSEGRLSISESEAGAPALAIEAIQSRPVLIAPGGKWAMRTNAGNQERRTLLCLLADQSVLLLTISGGGLSLYEAGWLLRGKARGGMFECDSAIGLDGGGSTQLSVRDHPELDVTGFSPVQNFLLVMDR